MHWILSTAGAQIKSTVTELVVSFWTQSQPKMDKTYEYGRTNMNSIKWVKQWALLVIRESATRLYRWSAVTWAGQPGGQCPSLSGWQGRGLVGRELLIIIKFRPSRCSRGTPAGRRPGPRRHCQPCQWSRCLWRKLPWLRLRLMRGLGLADSETWTSGPLARALRSTVTVDRHGRGAGGGRRSAGSGWVVVRQVGGVGGPGSFDGPGPAGAQASQHARHSLGRPGVG